MGIVIPFFVFFGCMESSNWLTASSDSDLREGKSCLLQHTCYWHSQWPKLPHLETPQFAGLLQQFVGLFRYLASPIPNANGAQRRRQLQPASGSGELSKEQKWRRAKALKKKTCKIGPHHSSYKWSYKWSCNPPRSRVKKAPVIHWFLAIHMVLGAHFVVTGQLQFQHQVSCIPAAKGTSWEPEKNVNIAVSSHSKSCLAEQRGSSRGLPKHFDLDFQHKSFWMTIKQNEAWSLSRVMATKKQNRS